MNCHRCRGLMCPIDLGIEASNSGRDGAYAWRCISCGEIIDHVIVWNRMRAQTSRPNCGKHHRPHGKVRTLVSSESSGIARPDF